MNDNSWIHFAVLNEMETGFLKTSALNTCCLVGISFDTVTVSEQSE